MPSVTAKVANTIGTAPRRPAQPSTSRSPTREALADRDDQRRQRPREHGGGDGDRRALERDVAEVVREHEQPEHQEQRELGDPREAVVEGDDRAPGGRGGGAEHEPGEVDGEEARSRAACRRRRRRARPWRSRRPGTGRRTAAARAAATSTPSAPTARPDDERRCRAPATASTSASSDAEVGSWIASMQPITSRIAIGSLMPDSPSSVRASRRRSVEPRSTANTAAASVAATVEPSSSAGSGSRSRISARRDRGQRRGEQRAERGERRSTSPAPGGSPSKPLDRPPSNRISASATMPACARELEVVEVDPAEPVGADQHAEAEHEHEAGQAQTPRRERGGETRRQQEAGEQEELTLVQGLAPCQTHAPDESPGRPASRRRHLRSARRALRRRRPRARRVDAGRRRADARRRSARSTPSWSSAAA